VNIPHFRSAAAQVVRTLAAINERLGRMNRRERFPTSVTDAHISFTLEEAAKSHAAGKA
jgi:hypothetical protein